ncbi:MULTISPECIES: hypothetical protein [Rhodococcus]|jgi:hypothetical protein|uniref:Transposase n=1 Tax=Rhodococcus jostii TaxID=132919 RepID=A0ABU4CEU3_RHOJO|nr:MULTISPECIES: hypothetical protein [Rhodococcus]MDI9948043.1 hypothetical protein [Rhodococcus sp. IEGM 1305]MDV6281785.1 hypothetical protein [Rhodococcus jostii]
MVKFRPPSKDAEHGEHKADAVALVVRPNPGGWVKQARIDRGQRDGLSSEERAELTRLHCELAKVAEERDLLKRATAF